MGFRTIDLDTKEGMEKYKKLKETKSVQETFGDKGVEKFAPRPEEQKESGELPPKVEPKKDTTQDNIVRTGVVKGVSQLRVRTKPEGDILYLISEKSIIKILEDQDGWYKVETAPGRVGFVMKQFIEVRTEGG